MYRLVPGENVGEDTSWGMGVVGGLLTDTPPICGNNAYKDSAEHCIE